ncbi:uncharacterized protein G2W53_010018 [Senna tora]|uniref:Uncharacterized protein n=1 Tax=Senna tora TaxID=362788 RepID=A0A834WZF2_9FABA|nr:uncharacterized protein G2W53_010018 [Senna tora]
MLQLESSWHGRSVDHVSKYSGRQIAVGSQKPSRIMRQKNRCASESNTSVRVVLANRSGFDAPIGVVLAWEERGSCLNIFRTQIAVRSQKPSRITRQKTCCASESNTSKPSRITREKTSCASESNTPVRVVLANRSGFDAPIGVVLAWEERGSPLPNDKSRSDLRNPDELRGKRLVAQVSQTRRFAMYFRTEVVLMLQLASSWHGRSVDHVLTYSGRQIAVGSQKPSRITRKNTCCATEPNTSHGRSVDHVLTYSGRPIAVGPQKPSRITKKNTCCASESNTPVRVVLANRSGFDVPIGVVLAWEERESPLNIFRKKNHGQISETFTNYEAKDLLRKSVDHLLTYSGRQIAVGSQKPSRITRQNTCCASESNTSVRVVPMNRSGFDAPIGVVLAWEESGSPLNIFRTTNRGRISETFTNYEAKHLLRRNLHELRGKRLAAQVSQTRRFALYLPTGVVLMLQLESSWHGRSVDHVLTYSVRQIAVGSQKPSRITRQKTRCASVSNMSVHVVLANRSCFNDPIGVVLAWEERGSCLDMFRTTNHGQILETFLNYEARDSLCNESNTPVRVVLANRSGFDVPIGVVLAWVERGSPLNIFRKINRGRISATFTNYEAKHLLRK